MKTPDPTKAESSTPNKCNGLTTPHNQPAKILTKFATDFIARCTLFASGFYLNRGIDPALCVAFVLVLLQAVLMAVWGVL